MPGTKAHHSAGQDSGVRLWLTQHVCVRAVVVSSYFLDYFVSKHKREQKEVMDFYYRLVLSDGRRALGAN